MNKNLHDKLGEAADNYANNVVAKSLFLREDYVLGVKEDFITGAEHGYKEAIEQAKEWLHNNLHLYIMSGSRQINYTFLMDGLEKAMNKLWEGEK